MSHLRKLIQTTVLASVIAGCSTTIPAALAEGYPGMGDRLKYAEALPHYNLGNRYLAKAWYPKAVEKYRDAIEIYPFDADVYINLGMALRKMNDLPRAEWAYKQAVKLNPDDWMPVSNLANVLMLQDKFAESLETFNKALKYKDWPEEEKKTIVYNIDGIKKIMKNKGLIQDNKKPEKVASKANNKSKTGKNTKKASQKPSQKTSAGNKVVPPKNNAADQQSYEDWIGG